MTRPDVARYRTTNWKSYDDALRRQGSLLIWRDRDMVWLAPKVGRNGRPPVFGDAAIQFCLMVKVLFGLPLRQTTGMVASILSMAGLDWPIPDFPTRSRRQKTIEVQITQRGAHRRRQYRKVHLAMESDTGDICAVEFTSSDKGNSPVLPHLLDQIPPDERIGTVTGDGAFDTRRCHTTILERGDIAVIPIRKNGRRRKEDCRFRLRPGRNHVCANRQGVRDTLFLVLPPYPTLGKDDWRRPEFFLRRHMDGQSK